MRYLFAAIVLIISNSVSAGLKEDALKHVPVSKLIKVTGHPDYPPVVWAAKGGEELHGVAVELMELAFSELGVKVKTFNSGTWGRAQEEVKEGRIDILLPPYQNAERLLVYEYFKNPILKDETVIFVKKGKAFSFKKFEDLVGKSGVTIIDDSFGNEFDKFMKEKLKIERLAKTEQCFEFLAKDRAQYMIAGLNAGLAVAKKNGVEKNFEILPKRVVMTGMFAPISKKSEWNHPAIHKFINTRIAAYAKSGLVKKLENKYWEAYAKE